MGAKGRENSYLQADHVIMQFSAEHEHRAKTLPITKQRIGFSLGPKYNVLPILGMVT